MRIAQIEITGFRGINSGVITLPQHCVLIGGNNVGKTAITDSLALLFGRERVSYQLGDWDFFGGNPKPQSRFTIVCTVTEFSTDNPADHDDWFASESAAQPVWWHSETNKVSFEADCPDGARLAAQIAICGRYEDEDCEFQTKRYFYNGRSDPFTDGCDTVSLRRVEELGVFFIPADRQWDRLMSFGSSTFLKALRQSEAMPGDAIEKLKAELRSPNSAIEEAGNFKPLVSAAEDELRRFMMLEPDSDLVYRPTSLDTFGVLQNLLPHIRDASKTLLPLSRHGGGTVSLQSFLIVLAIGERRRKLGKNFIMVAEEPELHLHPSLHRLLANRIRAVSNQSIVTTHSPIIASVYKPKDSIFIRNSKGTLTAEPLRAEPVKEIKSNSIKKLYLQKRAAFYEALLGGAVIVPEGEFDFEWLRMLQQVCEGSYEGGLSKVMPISIVPTQDAAIVDTYVEVARLRPDALPFIDGDADGRVYLTKLCALPSPPISIIQLGTDAGIEMLAAWVLEPALSNPGAALSELLPVTENRNLRALKRVLIERKADRELRENLAADAVEDSNCIERASEFFSDVAAILRQSKPSSVGWEAALHPCGTQIYSATHISRKQK